MKAMVVHILRGGRALCGREGIPNTWNESEKWVSWNEVMNSKQNLICKRCLDIFWQDKTSQGRRTGKSRAKNSTTRS